jgi:hypothetical protein
MDKTVNQSKLADLSTEIYDHIFSFLTQPELRACRLLNRRLCALATGRAFRHIRLDGDGDASALRFKHIVASDHLRCVVREITCDTYVGAGFEYGQNHDYELPEAFFRALPYLRFFHNLQVLNIRFDEHCGVGRLDPNSGWGHDVEETNDFRYAVLAIIFHCLAGSWSIEAQKRIEEASSLDIFSDIDEYESEEEKSNDGINDETTAPSVDLSHLSDVPLIPIALKTLTISHLADFNDERLTMSNAFRAVIESGHLTTLKLMIATEDDSNYAGYDIFSPEKYDMFESMPQTWLAPALAQNLRELSLYSMLKWGWHVQLDFRKVNPLAGENSGFPNLRVLALGSYIFTQDWQVDWIASLGKQNGSGGLTELYLDKCAIMFHAVHKSLFEDSTTVLGKDPSGREVIISNEGLPLKTGFTRFLDRPRGWARTVDPQLKTYPLRWYQVLHRWKETMTSLKVFKMGQGSWNNDPPAHTICVNERIELEESSTPSFFDERKHRNMFFRTYDCPTPLDAEFGTSYWGEPHEKYLHGTGLCQEKYFQIDYIRFDDSHGSHEWIPLREDVYSGAPEMEPEAAPLDAEALEALYETVKERRLRGSVS